MMPGLQPYLPSSFRFAGSSLVISLTGHKQRQDTCQPSKHNKK